MNPLAPRDYESLLRSYVTAELADAEGIFRVNNLEGAEIVGRSPKEGVHYDGIVFCFRWPGELRTREYRLRRDKPDLTPKPGGGYKESAKYLSPPGRGNLFYIPVGTPAEWLSDPTISVTFVEGEKKAIALFRYYRDRGEKRLVIGIVGVWGWRGTREKVTDDDGTKRNVNGAIADFDRITWANRVVLVVFDVNASTNDKVAAARRALCSELRQRGASAGTIDLPPIDGVNGIDDLLGAKGPDFVTQVLAGSVTSVTDSREGWDYVSPFDEQKAEPFPLQALPLSLRRHVQEVSTWHQTPLDLAAIVDLTVTSAAVARVVRVVARHSWSEPLNIYSVVAMSPASRKSEVYRYCVKPLELEERQRHHDLAPKIEQARAALNILEMRLAHLSKVAAKKDTLESRNDVAEQAEKVRQAKSSMPIAPKLIVQDITPERLKSELAAHKRIALLSPEGDIFEIMAGRYSSNGATNLDPFLKGWSGDDLRVDRQTRSEIVERPALSMGLMVQPSVIASLASKREMRGHGLLARLLITIPDSTVGVRQIKPDPIGVGTQEAYEETIRRLSRISYLNNENGEDSPRWLRLSREADDELAKFQQWIEPRLGQDGDLASIADWAGKLAGTVVRIAGILHLADYAKHLDPWPEYIEASTLNAAAEIGRYLISHARRAFALMGLDERIADAQHITRWIEAHVKETKTYQFTRRQAHRGMHSRFQTVDKLTPPLKLLEDHGYIRPLDPSGERRNGRPSFAFEINPYWISEIPVTKVTEPIQDEVLSPLSPHSGGFKSADAADDLGPESYAAANWN